MPLVSVLGLFLGATCFFFVGLGAAGGGLGATGGGLVAVGYVGGADCVV